MNLKLTCLTLGALLTLGLGSLNAQDGVSRWSVSAAAGLGTDSLNMITNSGTSWTDFGAYNFDVGYRGMVADSGVPFRASIGLNYCPAGRNGIVSGPVQPSSDLRSLTGYYLAGDLFINSRIDDNLFFIMGMSLNKWEMTQTVDNVKTYYSIRNPKFGLRFGLEYKISDNMAFDALFQMIEFGHNKTMLLADPNDNDKYLMAAGTRPWNPSWLQFGFKYTF